MQLILVKISTKLGIIWWCVTVYDNLFGIANIFFPNFITIFFIDVNSAQVNFMFFVMAAETLPFNTTRK